VKGKPEKLDRIIAKVLLKKGITKNIQQNKIQAIINSCLKEHEKEHVKINYIKNNKLFLIIDTPSLLYDIQCFRKNEILQKIKNDQELSIAEIKFQMGQK